MRIFGANFTGAGDLYWYARAESSLKSLKDATDKTVLGFSSNGSSSNTVAVALAEETGGKMKLLAAGDQASTFTQVMSGQIDIGWSAPPYVVEESRAGKVRVIARESDLEAFRNQTVRMNFTNMTVLTTKADQLKRFIAAYEETLDWMYAEPAGIKTYAEFAGITEDQAKYIRDTYFPKNNLIPRRLSGLDNAMADALAMKFINAPLTKDQLDEFLKYYVK